MLLTLARLVRSLKNYYFNKNKNDAEMFSKLEFNKPRNLESLDYIKKLRIKFF